MSRPVPHGASAQIRRRQDEPHHLQRLLAYSHLYVSAQWWRRIRTSGTILLAAVAPVAVFLVPTGGEILAALGAGWLVASRTVLAWLEEYAVLRALRVQELYETRLFELPWNTALAGREPSPEDVTAAAAHIRHDRRHRDWFSIDLRNTPWPGDVLLCQRQSMVWSRRDHRAYGTVILTAGLTWFVIGLALALYRDLSLSAYLLRLFLPSCPALLDCVELARNHWRHAARREKTEQEIQDLWDAHRTDPAGIDPAECRRIQDAAFLLRRDGPRVSGFFYRLRRSASTHSTRTGAAALLSRPDGLP